MEPKPDISLCLRRLSSSNRSAIYRDFKRWKKSASATVDTMDTLELSRIRLKFRDARLMDYIKRKGELLQAWIDGRHPKSLIVY